MLLLLPACMLLLLLPVCIAASAILHCYCYCLPARSPHANKGRAGARADYRRGNGFIVGPRFIVHESALLQGYSIQSLAFRILPVLFEFAVGGLGIEFYVLVVGWMHAFRSGWASTLFTLLTLGV